MGTKLHQVYDTGEERALAFHCPGCGCAHVIPVSGPKKWGWNGSSERPTFTPSIKTWGRQDKADLCHSFVTDGKIQFLGDSRHALKGQTVEIPDWDDELPL